MGLTATAAGRRAAQRPAIYPRSAWGAAEELGGRRIARMYTRDHPYTRITIHHTNISVSPEQLKLAEDWLSLAPDRRAKALLLSREFAARHLRQVQRLHQSKGWNDIGYHFMVDWMGRIYEGRPLGALGAHIENQNLGNIGIALMGDLQHDQPSFLQQAAVEQLVLWLAYQYGIAPDAVKTHRDYANTDCPGDRYYPQLTEIRRDMRRPGRAPSDPSQAVAELLQPWAPGKPMLADTRLAQQVFIGLLPR